MGVSAWRSVPLRGWWEGSCLLGQSPAAGLIVSRVWVCARYALRSLGDEACLLGVPSLVSSPPPTRCNSRAGTAQGSASLQDPLPPGAPCRGRRPGDSRGGPGASASGLHTGPGEIAGERKTSSQKRRGLPGSIWGSLMSLQAWLPADPERGIPET